MEEEREELHLVRVDQAFGKNETLLGYKVKYNDRWFGCFIMLTKPTPHERQVILAQIAQQMIFRINNTL